MNVQYSYSILCIMCEKNKGIKNVHKWFKNEFLIEISSDIKVKLLFYALSQRY